MPVPEKQRRPAVKQAVSKAKAPVTRDEGKVPPATMQALRKIAAAAGKAKLAARGGTSGSVAIFAGPDIAGKTMAAAVLAEQTGRPLLRVALSQVVSKYIGETEKNLRRVFEQAQASHAILFFDEADALFGKRSKVQDSHNRYANPDTDTLLQQLESFQGMAILATKSTKNIDPAFTRRLRCVVRFPRPV